MNCTYRTSKVTRRALAALGWLLGLAPAHAIPLATQSVQVEPGWNAVYLEVEPQDTDPEAVFADLQTQTGLTLESAWTWDSGSAVQFLRDPAEGLANRPGWRVHYPAGGPTEFLSNLYAIPGQRAYLLKLGGSGSAVPWDVTGRPSARSPAWTPDSFNLRGFPLDPGAEPSFDDFFAPSAAHAGQAVYRLEADGTWRPAAASETMRSGEAYYVYCAGGSGYSGPFELELELGDGLDYGDAVAEFQVRLRRLAAGSGSLTLSLAGGAAPVPLAYRDLETVADPNSAGDTISRIVWPDLSGSLLVPAASGQDAFVRLAVRRAELGAARADSVLSVSDGAGTRWWVPVTARPAAGAGTRSARACSLPVGLWVGTARITGISEAQAGGTTPTDLGTDASFRILVHVDAGCQARLLRSVVLLWQNGTFAPDPNDSTEQVVDVPGHYVLLTDDTLIPSFQGASLRDGEPVGYRISAIAYDFDEPAAGPSHVTNTLELTGTYALGSTLTAAMSVGPNHPTNPFLHRYHPDHDNLDARGIPLDPNDPNDPRPHEAFGFSRTLVLTLDTTDPLDADGDAIHEPRPDWTVDRLEGTFQDSISGVHRNDIVVAGTVTLQRASSIAVLNQ